MDIKRIFVLGNGFDLAHYLPTAYEHFMNAMKIIESCEEEKKLGFDNLFQKYLSGECSNRDKEFFSKTKELYKTDDFKLSIDNVKDLQTKLKDNGWFQHFKHHLNGVDTWIDFENEIEEVLISFSTIFNINFEYSTISDNERDVYPGIEPEVDLKKILTDNEKWFNWKLLNSTGIKTQYFLNLLKNFGILKDVYGHIIYEVENKSGRQPLYIREETKRLERQEYEVLVEYKEKIINEYTTRTNKRKSFSNIIETIYLNRNSSVYLSFKELEVYRNLLTHLKAFLEIFTGYIDLVINRLEPSKHFRAFGDLGKEIDAIYTFNYSDTFERLYPNSLNKEYDRVQYIHGSAEHKNIVLGISDLDEKNLRKYKIYGFVKTFQKLINNTDYRFLDDTDVRDMNYVSGTLSRMSEKYEIIIWGHSLDASDAEYIKEIFNLNDAMSLHKVKIVIWYHSLPHTQLANLMHIMGKDIIQTWMKEGWLVFEAAPDIYQINKPKQSLLEVS